MKTVISLSLSYVLLAALVSCGVKSSQKQESKVKVEEIKLNSSDYGMMAEDLVDSISFLKLTETKESFFVAINKAVIYDSMIYVLDKFWKNSLVAFDMQGDFVTAFGERGNGENEYVRLWDFDVSDSTVYLYDRTKTRMLCYTPEGRFKKILNTPFRAKSFKLLPNGKILFALDKEDGQSKVYLTNLEMSVEHYFFSYGEDDLDDFASDNYFRVYGDTIYYNNAVNDSVYMFSKAGGLVGCYHFDFNGNNVPDKEKGDFDKLSDDEARFGYIYLNEVPMVIKNYVIGVVTNGGEKGLFLYDKVSKKGSIKSWKINELRLADIVLPVYATDDYVVGWMDSSVYEALVDKDSVPSDLVEHMDNGGRVLIFYHLKS